MHGRPLCTRHIDQARPQHHITQANAADVPALQSYGQALKASLTGAPAPAAAAPTPTAPAPVAAAAPTPVAAPTAPGQRVVASGYAKKLAAEAGVDLLSVPGTGLGGRVSGADVIAAAGGKAPAKPVGYRLPAGSATPSAKKLAAEAGLDLKTLKVRWTGGMDEGKGGGRGRGKGGGREGKCAWGVGGKGCVCVRPSHLTLPMSWQGTGEFGRITADDILIATGKKSPIKPKKPAAAGGKVCTHPFTHPCPSPTLSTDLFTLMLPTHRIYKVKEPKPAPGPMPTGTKPMDGMMKVGVCVWKSVCPSSYHGRERGRPADRHDAQLKHAPT